MRSIHYSDVPELSPKPLIVRRTGGGLGLNPNNTFRGNYVLVPQESDDVTSSTARFCLGSIPIDLVSRRNAAEERESEVTYRYHQQHEIEKRSARNQQQQQPAGSMIGFGGSSLFLSQDDFADGSFGSPIRPKTSELRIQQHTTQITSPVKSPRGGNTKQQQQPTIFSARKTTTATSARSQISNAPPKISSTTTTTKTKKTAALTPGALRIIKGQLQNGASIETVVRRQAQCQKDRIYRPRNDRLAEQESNGAAQRFEAALSASLFAAGVPPQSHAYDHQESRNAKLENYYSPSRRGNNVSTIPFSHDEHKVAHDSKTAIDFDPYALSLLSTLPPLSATTDPFINARAELRRPHQMNSCPGAVVMHTALGHLRAVGAVPFLLDCQYGVYAVQPKLTEQEKLQLLEEEAFDFLSSSDDDSHDDAEDPFSLSLTKGMHSSSTKNRVANNKRHRLMSREDFVTRNASSLSLLSGDGEDSPNSAFRKTAMELLAPVPKSDYEVPAITHRSASFSAGTSSFLNHQHQKRLAEKPKSKDGGEVKTIQSGITISIDGRALSDPSARVTRPKFRVFCIFCERHPLPGLRSVCRVPHPKPAPEQWNVTDIIACFGWRADSDLDHSVDDVVGDAFFKNTGLKEHAWESQLMERRLVFQFFAPPEDDSAPYDSQPYAAGKKQNQRGANLLKKRGAFHRTSVGDSVSSNTSVIGGAEFISDEGENQEFNFFQGGGSVVSASQPDGAKHKPFRVHDFEMNSAAEAGYQVFTWESFSREFSRAVGEAFLRGV